MRVSISGTHSTGKSTLIQSILTDSFFSGCVFLDGPTRFLEKQGFPINNEADNYDQTQLMCLAYDLQKLRETSKENFVFSDRSLLDTFVYTKYLYQNNKVSSTVFSIIKEVWEVLRTEYDCFFIPSKEEVLLVEDGVRSTDHDFRDSVSEIFDEVIREYSLSTYSLKGTVEERIEKIKGISISLKK